ncbi:cell wall metabolism sensor histidine kinase WalK [Streptomyces sp. PT12]|uniref:sensor histidine kinase n=1 Tax=Streptomyces sp. PT12 TaxID=1510197 RepID=UPI000DE579EB|nr:HAMP domain-containing sensor histidine kinase [Streptomyces sp. PT12]RBM20403.1 two-component sensor histidine kinase [Streptomyces sp. PT12]
MASVRARAAFGATLVVAVALVTAGILMVALLEREMVDRVDLQAEADGRDVAGQLGTGVAPEELRLEGLRGPVQVIDRSDDTAIAVTEGLDAIWGTRSTDVDVDEEPPPVTTAAARADDDDASDDDASDDDDDASDDDDDEDGDDSDSDDEEVDGGEDGLPPGEMDEEIGLINGAATVRGEREEYRFAAVEVTMPSGTEAIVFAGAPLSVEQAAVDSVRTSMFAGVPALVAVVGGVTWLTTRRAFRPVEGIRREMAAITHSEDLSRRVPEPETRDEIGRLAVTTNETLAALEASVERQRRFVADASHELRSPIASLRTQLEVGEAHPELLDLPGAVKDTVRLQALAADLLLLARLDAGERPLAGTVGLAELVAEELDQRVGDRHPVRLAELGEATVSGSAGQLSRVLANLVDNAQRHAASAVRVSLRAEGADAVLEVADDGPGVPEADRERIFQRFVRLDDARGRDEGGAGLGLAIARDVATRHGGTLTAGAAPEGGALFALRLPLGTAAPRPGGDPDDVGEAA